MTQSAPIELLGQRYRNGALPSAAAWNDTLALLMAHRSVRRYRDDPVSDDILGLAVAAAQSASNSQNIQPWSVVAVRDRARVAELAKASLTQTFVATAPLYLAWLLDLSRLSRSIAELGGDVEVLHGLDPLLIGAIDVALAAQNAAIYFESAGLGVVFIGALRYMPELVIDTLALPEHVLPMFGMCVGYADPEEGGAIKPRLPQDLVLHRESYRPPDEALLREYNEDLQAFRLERDMSIVDWQTYSAKRFMQLQDRVGREQLDRRIRDLGFGR